MSLRVLIAVTHLLGAGHLTRAAAIGRALADAGHAVTLVSGGRPTAVMSGAGLDIVQLPPVQAGIDSLGTLRDETGAEVGPDLLASRRKLLLGTLADRRPDILVTELFPFGRRSLVGEFTALLEAAHAMQPRPAILCSIRDILVAPDKPEKVAKAHERLARFYDGVLVHGDPALVRLEASWPVGDGVGTKLTYTGYVDAEDGPSLPGGRGRDIVVSGGSSAAALPLYRAALAAAAIIADRPWRILVGRGVPEAEMSALARSCLPHVTVERARPGFRDLMQDSAVFVGQAGYNTVVDLIATGARAVIVPFEAGGETEQRLRAEMLAARGLAALLSEAELSAEALAACTKTALAGPPPPTNTISRDGARRTAAIVAEIARNRGRP